MKGYQVSIWRECFMNGEFTHNSSREVVIHANNKKDARQKAKNQMQEKEFIYKITLLGKVVKIIETRYEYKPLKHPKYEPEF